MYVYTHIYVYVCVYIYIYTHINKKKEFVLCCLGLHVLLQEKDALNTSCFNQNSMATFQ